MIFSSITFLFYFLPLIFLFYRIVPISYRNIVLLIGSLFFYAFGEPLYILLLLFSVGINFYLGKYIYQQKFILLVSLISNIGLLVFFKYTTFLMEILQVYSPFSITIKTIALPLGISFYTFQIISYLIDVYWGNCKAQNSLLNFATYVTMFPQLIAGPIVRYSEIEQELTQRQANTESGITLFILGLSEKVLLANNIGLIFEETSKRSFSMISAPTAWISITAFAFQIYFDFCGYSHMAIGLGHMFGFHFPKNFNDPYISCSITEFWRRWHITLSSWFKEYVYIPLGGNRKGIIPQIINIFIVWSLTGLWHGASYHFLLWGMYFAILLILEKLFLLKILNFLPTSLQHLYAIITILIGWVLFAFSSVADIMSFYKCMFDFTYQSDTYFNYLIGNHYILLFLCTLFSTPFPKQFLGRFFRKSFSFQKPLKYLLLFILFLLCISYIVDDSYNPFLYFRF